MRPSKPSVVAVTYQQRQQEYGEEHGDVSFDIYAHGLEAWQVHKDCAAQPKQVYRVIVYIASAALTGDQYSKDKCTDPEQQ